MSNDIIDNFLKNNGSKTIEQMKTMSDQQVINEFWSQSNNPMVPQQIKDYLNNNRDKINEAIKNLHKQF